MTGRQPTGRVAGIWRHPVKSHGREALAEVALSAGRTLPGDRVWAVAHEASTADGSAWAPCANFTRAARAGSLNAIRARLDDATGRLTLTHPDLPPLAFDPETEPERLLVWSKPLIPAGRAQSARLLRVAGRGMTDTDFPSVSLLNAASNDDLSRRMGVALSPERWRGNFLLDGLAPWVEWGWIGCRLRLGEAVLQVVQRITRCNATKANPATGRVDADTLGALKAAFGHQDFGVYATVTQGGPVRLGDRLEPLP